MMVFEENKNFNQNQKKIHFKIKELLNEYNMKNNVTNNSINITNIKDDYKNLENKTETGIVDNDIKIEN